MRGFNSHRGQEHLNHDFCLVLSSSRVGMHNISCVGILHVTFAAGLSVETHFRDTRCGGEMRGFGGPQCCNTMCA